MMNSGKQDMYFNRTSLHSLTIPWGLCLNHHEAPLSDPYGVSFHLESASCYDTRYSAHFSCLPLQGHLGLCDYSSEPSFIRKRNERERQRVRFVNEGYARLRQHLPQDLAEKRLSKVETLRAAIGYIKRLQGLLDLEALASPLEHTGSISDTITHGTSPPRRECGTPGLCDSPPHPLCG